VSIFFVSFVLIGAFFILNIFDNIVIDNFMKEKARLLGIEKFNKS